VYSKGAPAADLAGKSPQIRQKQGISNLIPGPQNRCKPLPLADLGLTLTLRPSILETDRPSPVRKRESAAGSDSRSTR
jgi:hypothetical protein